MLQNIDTDNSPQRPPEHRGQSIEGYATDQHHSRWIGTLNLPVKYVDGHHGDWVCRTECHTMVKLAARPACSSALTAVVLTGIHFASSDWHTVHYLCQSKSNQIFTKNLTEIDKISKYQHRNCTIKDSQITSIALTFENWHIYQCTLHYKYSEQIKLIKIHFLTLACCEFGRCKKLVSVLETSIVSNTTQDNLSEWGHNCETGQLKVHCRRYRRSC